LRTVRHLSASGTGLYVAVQACGALIGFLIGAYLADAIGRKWTFFISAVSTILMVVVYMYLPVANDLLLWLGIPLSMAILMKFSPMGPFMTELYPTELRGTGQGFCYNGGRAIGSFFPTMVGFASQIMPLGSAIVLFCCLASGLMIVMLPLLPETRGRTIAASQPALERDPLKLQRIRN
jgi:MFS family permease